MTIHKAVLLASMFAFSTNALYAQECPGPAGNGAKQACNLMWEAGQIVQARAGMALTGGNPVPGATSTLGMRIGSVPRISVALRATGVGIDVPSLDATRDDDSGLAHSFDVDVAVGLFSGFTIAPTIGGFGSVDIVASAGKLGLPGSLGYDKAGPASWAAGARVGILRESFTAPGISVTAMYRHIGDIGGSDSVFTPGGQFNRSLSVQKNSVVSVRGVIGKRLFVVGANAGLGYDAYKSDIRALASSLSLPPGNLGGGTSGFNDYGHKQHRVTAFANATWTMLILNFVAEAGYQKGGDKFTADIGSTHSSKTENAGYYGSLAIRLAL